MDVPPALVEKESGRRREAAALGRRDGLVVARERLPVREGRAGRLRRAACVLGGRRPRLRLAVVVGEPGRQLGEPVGMRRSSASPARRWSSRRREGQERRLGDVLRERVLEDVHDVVAGRALVEELQPGELAEVRLHRARAVPDRREERG